MSNSFIQAAVDGNGKKIDTEQISVASVDVQRQRICVASPTNASGLADVLATAPTSSTYGQVSQALLAAIGQSTNPAQVSDGGGVRVMADRTGKLVIVNGAPVELAVTGKVNVTTTTATDVIAAQGAGVKIALTHIHVSNGHTVAVRVDIRDGTTVKWQTFASANGGGAGETLMVPIVGTANTAWTVQLGAAAATNGVYICLIGYLMP